MDRAAVADPVVGQLLDHRYRVEARLARGGMATVYVATDLRLDRRVALKVIPQTLSEDDEFAIRFVREARAAARLTHPNVVAVYDQGQDGGVLFLAMEFVDGRQTLRDVIRNRAPMPPAAALAIVEEILRALSAAHEVGIVHRDIKPENVLIGPRGEIKVADFGLARAISSATSATATGGVLMGTVSYLPPELVVDGTADARSDVYAVGVLLFELLTGSKPHAGDSPIQIAYKHVHNDVPPPSGLVAGIAPYVDALVARATSRQRDLRPADAHVMLQQLRRVRHAVDHGVSDDAELTADLTPTVAVSQGPFAAADEVFDQEAMPVDARTIIVGSPAFEPDHSTTAPAPRFVPPQAPNGSAGAPPAPGAPARPTRTRRRRRRRGWLALLLVLVLAIAAGAAGWYFGDGRFKSTPDVVGLTQASASARLDAAGLRLTVTSAAYSEQVPDGRLISTDPGPGDHVVKGGTVDAVISKGPERHDVPNLSGMSQHTAEAAIRARSLVVAEPIVRAWSASVPQGQVVSFTPKAGLAVKRATPVHVVISRGPKPITIPNYTHKDGADARQALDELGFKADVAWAYDDDVAAGLVIRQTPASGTGSRDDHISVLISKGPHLVKVPDVNHDGVSAAEQTLRTAGFKVVEKPYTPSFGLGFVVAQTPGGGQMAPYGSTVTIYVV